MQWMSTGPALEDKTIFKQINVRRTVKYELLVNLSSREPSWPNSDTSSRTFKPGAQKLKLSMGDCGQSNLETATVTTSPNTNHNQAVTFCSQVDGRSILRSPAWNFSSEAASDLMRDKVIAFWRYYCRLGSRYSKNIINHATAFIVSSGQFTMSLRNPLSEPSSDEDESRDDKVRNPFLE